jgi:hypothetical protein
MQHRVPQGVICCFAVGVSHDDGALRLVTRDLFNNR